MKMALNRVMMIENLGQDPEIRYTPNGLPLANFSLATDESYLDKEGERVERVVWHRIVAAEKLALVCHKYLKEGRQVVVEGRLRYAEWESNSDGRKQHRTSLLLACKSWVRRGRKHCKAPNPIRSPGHPTVTSHFDYAKQRWGAGTQGVFSSNLDRTSGRKNVSL
jgi:single-strand DNA-binding protein